MDAVGKRVECSHRPNSNAIAGRAPREYLEILADLVHERLVIDVLDISAVLHQGVERSVFIDVEGAGNFLSNRYCRPR